MSSLGPFDPYEKWLGIPSTEQPPDHYRLMGLVRFEQDPAIIRDSVDQRIRLVNSYKRGPYVKVCEQLLHRINAAKACLLNPGLKMAYDRKLAGGSESAKASAGPAPTKVDGLESKNGHALTRQPANRPFSQFPDLSDPLSLDSLLGVNSTAAGLNTRQGTTPGPSAGAGKGNENGNGLDFDIDLIDPAGQDPLAHPNALGGQGTRGEVDSRSAVSDQLEPLPEPAPLGSPALPWIPEDAGYEVLPVPGDVAAPTSAAPIPATAPSNNAESPLAIPSPQRSIVSRLVLPVLLVACILGAAAFIWNNYVKSPSLPVGPRPVAVEAVDPGRGQTPPLANVPPAPKPAAKPAAPVASDRPEMIEIGVAYGTEKRYWLEWAVQEFSATEDGKRIRVNLIPLGSLEAAHAILGGDTRIHVWSPASSLYRGTFVRDWETKHKRNPIAKEEILALTPMVFVIWKGRYDAFAAKYSEFSPKTIAAALEAEKGWESIAGKPEWGRFKFAHTHPNQSNSGLMTLVILAYEYHQKTTRLSTSDIMAAEYQDYLLRFGRGANGASNSTGNLMKDMVLKGPSGYDALMVYESVAIDYLKSAEGRWDQLQVVYPKYNLWSDNPYCILNTPWTTAAHQKAAEGFLKFLMSEPVQLRALEHGFRPGNPKVPVKSPQSPFVQYAQYGLQVDLAEVCEVPNADVIDNLLQSWIRNVPRY